MRIASMLAFAAAFVCAAPSFAQQSHNAKPSPALQTEFNGFAAKFRAALRANDSAAVAGMIRYPFADDAAYPDATQFRAKGYAKTFSAKTRACLQRGKAEYGRDGLNNDNYFIFCGQNIFTFTKTPAGFLLTEIGMND